MSWLDSIRTKSHHEKVRLIWTVAGIVAVLLAIVWIFTSRIGSKTDKDTTLFQSIGQGIKDIRDSYRK